MSARPSPAEQAFVTFLGMADLVLCAFCFLAAMVTPVVWPMVLATGLSAVALFHRATDTPAWSPMLWLGALPAGLILIWYVALGALA